LIVVDDDDDDDDDDDVYVVSGADRGCGLTGVGGADGDGVEDGSRLLRCGRL
jgi:hypothetical protein